MSRGRVRTFLNYSACCCVRPPSQTLAEDEAILFGGMTLARLTGIPALFHRVDVGGRERVSAPYFHRPSPASFIPATQAHDAELVAHFNARTRAAHDDELRSSGAVVVAPSEQRDFDRRLDRELRLVERHNKARREARSYQRSRRETPYYRHSKVRPRGRESSEPRHTQNVSAY